MKEVNDVPSTRRAVVTLCSSAAVDHAYVKADLRFSDIRLLALDMDSTLINIECIDELADFAGKRKEVADITAATMRGEIVDFSESLERRVGLLKGLDVDALRRVYEERLHLSPGAETLIKAARTNGSYLLLVSGGFTYFAERLKMSLGLDAAYANRLGTRDGRLTGRIEGEIIDASAKAARVQQAMQLSLCTRNQSVVIGDGANDIPMMKCVDHSIAYHAKLAVKSAAAMTIDYGGLKTALDYFL